MSNYFKLLLSSSLHLLLIFTLYFSTTSSGQAASWVLKWQDDFNSIDYSKWSKGWAWGRTNGVSPDTYYPYANVWTSGGKLVLRADGVDQEGHEWRGAAITTYDKYKLRKHSRWEARIRLPYRNGINPAFWLLPQDRNWPPEIDVVELPGSKGGNTAYMTAWRGTNSNPIKTPSYTYTNSNIPWNYHNYDVRRWSGGIEWFIDGVKRGATYDSSFATDKQMYALFTIVVADNPSWHGTPPSNDTWESYMRVDWLKVYQWE